MTQGVSRLIPFQARKGLIKISLSLERSGKNPFAGTPCGRACQPALVVISGAA